jgi:predicted dehydrogenase
MTGAAEPQGRRIGVGIIGANPERGWARLAHVPALRALPGVDITAVCTTQMESAREAARQWGVPIALDDARALVNHPAVDLVAVCVKVPDHGTVVAEALRAGKHVYCEWPLARNANEAAELEALARAAGVVTMVGLQGRAAPAVRRARELIGEGFVGHVLSAALSGATQLGGPRVPQEYAFGVDVAAGMNVLTVPTGHALDAVFFCIGEPDEVWARLARSVEWATVIETGAKREVSAPDQVIGGALLDSGAAVSFHVQGGASGRVGFKLDIYGDSGTLCLRSDGHLQRGEMALYGARGDADLEPTTSADEPLIVPSGPSANVCRMYRNMLAAIRTGNAAAPDFTDALRRHRLLDALTTASETGRHVSVPNTE